MAATHKWLKVMSKDDDLPPLNSLDERINAARRATQEEASPADNKSEGTTPLRSGAELIAGVAVGGFLGYYADDWLGTRPAFTIAGIFLGMAGAVMNICRAVSVETPQADDSVEGAFLKPDHTSKDN